MTSPETIRYLPPPPKSNICWNLKKRTHSESRENIIWTKPPCFSNHIVPCSFFWVVFSHLKSDGRKMILHILPSGKVLYQSRSKIYSIMRSGIFIEILGGFTGFKVDLGQYSKNQQTSGAKWWGHNCWWFRNPAVAPVEVGSLSHDLHGFSTIPGGWPWDFWTINSNWPKPTSPQTTRSWGQLILWLSENFLKFAPDVAGPGVREKPNRLK